MRYNILQGSSTKILCNFSIQVYHGYDLQLPGDTLGIFDTVLLADVNYFISIDSEIPVSGLIS